MKIRNAAAAVIATTVLGVAGAGVALAAPQQTATTPAAKCAQASTRSGQLETRLNQVEQRIATLTTRAATNTSTKIEARIGLLNADHTRIANRIAAIDKRCNLPAS